MIPYLGQLAALGTSVAWSFSSVFFTLSGREIGSAAVNRIRLALAVILVSLMHRLLEGSFFPLEAGLDRVGWLALSGVIGYVVGDGLLFQAFVLIGPRLSMLLMALAPVFSAIYGWLLFRQTLAPAHLAGIALALGGTALVIADRQPGSPEGQEQAARHRLPGILFGLGAALGQASGLVASRMGLAGDFPALSGNLIRLVAAALVIWLIAALRREAGSETRALRAHPRAVWAIGGGAVMGPFIGVWLSLIAIQHAPLGIAATLMALTPILLLPVSRLLFHEPIGRLAVPGTAVAFAGTALLFL